MRTKEIDNRPACACVVQYKPGEEVKLWVNKVGPFNNPQETYNYYTLPFCRPRPLERPQNKWGGLGEVLEGNQLVDSQLDIRFRVNEDRRDICSEQLDESDAEEFETAVRSNYWFELYMDDLPIWGFVGEVAPLTSDGDEDVPRVYTHRTFSISYNNDRIIHVNLTSSAPQKVEPRERLSFTYSVRWVPTSTKFSRRFERYLDNNFFEHKIHWFSIFNSCMMVIFLVGLVSMILIRTLKADYKRYADVSRVEADEDHDALDTYVSDETGWKLVHGDVFRPPDQVEYLSALVGTGSQLALLTLGTILCTITGSLWESRGAIVSAGVTLYALTSFVGGYVSGSLHSKNGGSNWIKCMLLTAGFFPGVCFAIGFALNTMAVFYNSLAALPFGTIIVMFLIWAFVTFPLTLAGTVLGRNYNGKPDNPCRVKSIPRPIPEAPWYLRPRAIAFMGGLLPFGSIFIEMYFIFTSFWNYKVYYVYGFFLLVFLILLAVVLNTTVVSTYFLLNAENYKWQWTSFASAASTAFYVYMYAVYFFFFKTRMTGLFQTLFYFGYSAMACLYLAIMCGAVGHLGANAFCKRIYSTLKVE